MARTLITPTELGANAGIDHPAGTTIDATLVTNGAYIADCEFERLILVVTNTEGDDNVLTIQSGDNPPSELQILGDITCSVDATTGRSIVGPFTSARVKQSDGSMEIDFESGFAGVIAAILLPRDV